MTPAPGRRFTVSAVRLSRWPLAKVGLKAAGTVVLPVFSAQGEISSITAQVQVMSTRFSDISRGGSIDLAPGKILTM